MTSRHSKKVLFLLPISSLFGLASCAVKKHDDILPPTLPSTFSASQQEKATVPFDETVLAKWWTKLSDPLLSELVEQGLLANYDIAMAMARIEQARAMSSAAGAEQMPTLSVAGSVTSSRASLKDPALGNAASAPGFERNNTTFKVGPTVAWEIDLFGRKKALREAAVAKQLATEADAQAIRLLVASEIAKGVVRLRSIQERIRISKDAALTESELVEILKARRVRGFVSEADVFRAEALALDSLSAEAKLASDYSAVIASLSVLLATEPQTLRKKFVDSAVLKVPDFALHLAGIPADLLRRRPDIKRAELNIVAARHNVDAAYRDRYPTLNLVGTLALVAGSVASLGTTDALFAAVAPTLAWKALDFGRISAEIDRSEGSEKEAYIRYKSTVFTAFIESETALTDLSSRELVSRRTEMGLQSQTKAWQIIKIQYEKGLIDSTSTLETRKALNRSAESVALANEAKSLAVVQAYQALGGGF